MTIVAKPLVSRGLLQLGGSLASSCRTVPHAEHGVPHAEHGVPHAEHGVPNVEHGTTGCVGFDYAGAHS